MAQVSLVKLHSDECHWTLLKNKSTMVQVMAWCRQATSHFLRQCWPRFMSPYGVTKPQWVNVTLQYLKCMKLWKYIDTVYPEEFFIMIHHCSNSFKKFLGLQFSCIVMVIKINAKMSQDFMISYLSQRGGLFIWMLDWCTTNLLFHFYVI